MKDAMIGTGAMAALMLAGAAFADSQGSAADKFTAMDADGDGAVTSAEFTSYASASGHDAADAELQFAVMAGDDGVLTIEELEAVMAVREKADDWEASTEVKSDTMSAPETTSDGGES
jgi:Ca2+-binding EF-hand superfamily protein